MIKSQALEANIASYHVDVAIDPKYEAIREVMSPYYGLMEGLTLFLKELSHPYKNWQFIVNEARGYALDYFHVFKQHDKGPEAAELFIDIFESALFNTRNEAVRADSVDNLILFLQKLVKETDAEIEHFGPTLKRTCERILRYEDAVFFLFVKSFYQFKRIGEAVLDNAANIETARKIFNRLYVRYLQDTYSYWLGEADPVVWFTREAQAEAPDTPDDTLFKDITHAAIQKYLHTLKQIEAADRRNPRKMLAHMLKLPGFGQFVATYGEIPRKLFELGKETGRGNQWKVLFLFHSMNISGLCMVHEETLRDINRTLSWLIGHESSHYINNLIEKTFYILKSQSSKFPATALNCVLNMGKGVYKTDDADLINFFIDGVIDLGFQAPMLNGVGNDWQIRANNAHVQNIRTWLELIQLNPKWSTRLISNLIIHISLGGVFIKDTDLFPRDITGLLNNDIGPVYNLIKQMAKLFPVYFNDIGAEGSLRDISTQIDEIAHRKDILIHFLRKQSHVESSNQILAFIGAVLKFWETKEKEGLIGFVPPSIYEQIESRGAQIDGVHLIIAALKERGLTLPDDFIHLSEQQLEERMQDIAAVSAEDLRRVQLFGSFYKLLYQKYKTSFVDIKNYIDRIQSKAFPDLNLLQKALAEKDLKKRIFKLLDYLERLKKLIVSPQAYEIQEDIYKKRHFTIDIPSMYGSYHETKFDALGLTFRIESLVNVLFEELVETIDLSLITKAAFYEIHDCLILFDKALKLDNISSVEMYHQLDLLAHSIEVKGFTITQYLDIFKGFAKAVKNIINDYFNNVHEENLNGVLERMPVERILPKYLPHAGIEDVERIHHRISEIFFRDCITLSVGIQQLDLFLSRILNTLFQQSEKLPKDELRKLLIYDPQTAMTPIKDSGSKVSQIIYLGSKGFNLIKMMNFGLPIPPGFIVTTEVFRFREIIETYPPAEKNFREQVAHQIAKVERETGRKFGDVRRPILFSVRSGSSISQPGMMDTFLDVGINEEIAAAFAVQTGNAWFAWDNYRRFLQCYGMSVGLERNDFDGVINTFKQKLGIPLKRNFTGKQMQALALAYKQIIKDTGVEVSDDPLEQLHFAIKQVLNSWESPRARTYRKIMGISDDWGTAVTIQQMVYGNISAQSGSGVFFTHNPRWSEDSLRLWGDFTTFNQGEDVVAGLVKTLPISISQQEIEMRETDITLETHFPEIFNTLKGWANHLIYEKGWSPQEMEFTFESPSQADLYLLQTRDMAIRERKKALAFDLDKIADDQILGHGIGVSGGAMSGRLVFSLEDIDQWRVKEPETFLILARADTVPDDIREIFAADALLTARGGVTSHAAVVAHRLGKTCVVGCGNLLCNEKAKTIHFDEALLESGDYISIDGAKGDVYRGLIDTIGSLP